MKKFFLTLLILTSVRSFATLRTVCNAPATLAQYSSIQAAIDASNSSGDTIYVSGSPNTYQGFTITNKQIAIIGPGWIPNKFATLKATISSICTINGAGSSGTELQGLIFNAGFVAVVLENNVSINNIRIIRNHFVGSAFNFGGAAFTNTTYTGYLFEGNFFQRVGVGSPNYTNTFVNFIFQNNLFYNEGGYSNIGNLSQCTNVLFNHNLFYSPPNVNGIDIGAFCSGLTLNNNIFVNRNAGTWGSYNIFSNNITYNGGNNTPWVGNNNVDAGGNIANQDPQMVDQVSINNGVINPILNFTISSGPANNSATDGKDMGLLYDAVGSLNWINSRSSFLPYIFNMNISNPTIAPGGTLNVIVEARKDN